MALPLVHLYVAKKILDSGFTVAAVSQFYLGAISPDAIHMREKTGRDDKNKVHLIPEGKKWITINDTEYCNFLSDFIISNKHRTDINFLLGYGVHILTDMYWVKDVYQNYLENYKKDPSPEQEERSAYYNDTDILDQMLFNETDRRKDVWSYLETSECTGFLDLLSAEEIRLWKERILHWFDTRDFFNKIPLRYITKADVDNFISGCSEKIGKTGLFSKSA